MIGVLPGDGRGVPASYLDLVGCPPVVALGSVIAWISCVNVRHSLEDHAVTLTVKGPDLHHAPEHYLSGAPVQPFRDTVRARDVSNYKKLDVSSRGEAVDRAIESGLLEPLSGLRFTGRPQGD